MSGRVRSAGFTNHLKTGKQTTQLKQVFRLTQEAGYLFLAFLVKQRGCWPEEPIAQQTDAEKKEGLNTRSWRGWIKGKRQEGHTSTCLF